jgi:hypothetical protein
VVIEWSLDQRGPYDDTVHVYIRRVETGGDSSEEQYLRPATMRYDTYGPKLM